MPFFEGGGWGGREPGSQQENSYAKYTVTNTLPVTAMLGRVDEASRLNECVDEVLRMNYVARLNISLDGNERALLLRIKTNRRGYRQGFDD